MGKPFFGAIFHKKNYVLVQKPMFYPACYMLFADGLRCVSMTPAVDVSCRKRLRGAEDECEECMPISKRINRLHIR